MQSVPAGDNATLVELGNVTAAELHAAARKMRAEGGVLAVIPGHSSLYVVRGSGAAREQQPHRLHRIPVTFDGPDLPELLARVPREEFLARVARLRLTARYLGFRGGFAYLDGWPEEWSMPRRPTSRPVPRGSFAIAGSVAGFYPIDTPGGWNLLGRTRVHLEHAIAAGDEIRIEVEGRPFTAYAELIASPLTSAIDPAPDWSRVERGLPPGGPFDDVAAGLALRAVRGNAELLECALVGPTLRFTRDAVVAYCTPTLELRVERVRRGDERAFGRIAKGLRAYIAIGEEEGPIERATRGDRHVIRAVAGPHDVGLRELHCEVTPQLDRVGIRLRPLDPIRARVPADLRSCGMQCGTVQLHPDGSVVAMGPDHPVTGGYLQPMTVRTSERWKLAQLMPGERVTLIAG